MWKARQHTLRMHVITVRSNYMKTQAVASNANPIPHNAILALIKEPSVCQSILTPQKHSFIAQVHLVPPHPLQLHLIEVPHQASRLRSFGSLSNEVEVLKERCSLRRSMAAASLSHVLLAHGSPVLL
jgi:hypothetical protein